MAFLFYQDTWHSFNRVEETYAPQWSNMAGSSGGPSPLVRPCLVVMAGPTWDLLRAPEIVLRVCITLAHQPSYRFFQFIGHPVETQLNANQENVIEQIVEVEPKNYFESLFDHEQDCR